MVRRFFFFRHFAHGRKRDQLAVVGSDQELVDVRARPPLLRQQAHPHIVTPDAVGEIALAHAADGRVDRVGDVLHAHAAGRRFLPVRFDVHFGHAVAEIGVDVGQQAAGGKTFGQFRRLFLEHAVVAAAHAELDARAPLRPAKIARGIDDESGEILGDVFLDLITNVIHHLLLAFTAVSAFLE